jgi:hypothetical protein
VPELGLPEFALATLSAEQQRALVENYGTNRNCNALGWWRRLTPFLRGFCDHPLFLTQILDYWLQKGIAPENLPELFETWLEKVAFHRELPARGAVMRRALEAIAESTLHGSIVAAHAVDELKSVGLEPDLIDELCKTGALRFECGRIEIVHEALADYLRSISLCRRTPEQIDGCIQNLDLRTRAPFFTVMLAGQLITEAQQRQLWARVAAQDLETYLSALHYRADTSSELLQMSSSARSEYYLTELLGGVDTLIDACFSPIRTQLEQQLAGEAGARLGIRGFVEGEIERVVYSYAPIEEKVARVQLESPIGELRLGFRNLRASRMRPDSARVLAAVDIREALHACARDCSLVGGNGWCSELLVSQTRLAEHLSDQALLSSSLDSLIANLQPMAGNVFSDRYTRGLVVVIDDLLELAFRLKSSGVSTLDLWWQITPSVTPEAWPCHWSAIYDSTQLSCLIQEHFRRVQLVYREVVESSFNAIASNLKNYPVLPVRYSLSVVETSARGFKEPVMYYDWRPVKDWAMAGADVEFATAPPAFDWESKIDLLRQELQALRRRSSSFRLGGFGLIPRFDGYGWTGTFEGRTSVLQRVCEMLKEDIDFAFDALRAR